MNETLYVLLLFLVVGMLSVFASWFSLWLLQKLHLEDNVGHHMLYWFLSCFIIMVGLMLWFMIV